MMVTNLCTNPADMITCNLDGTAYTMIPVRGKIVGVTYSLSMTVWLKDGSATIKCGNELITITNHATRLQDMRLTSNSTTIGILVSGSASNVVIGEILICTADQYDANKTMLDNIKYFTGGTMPLA